MTYTRAGRLIIRNSPNVDFDQDDLTEDNTWNDLDLSSIITDLGANAVAVMVEIEDPVSGRELAFRQNSASHEHHLITQIANTHVHTYFVLGLDADNVIEYKSPAAGISVINIMISGYFI